MSARASILGRMKIALLVCLSLLACNRPQPQPPKQDAPVSTETDAERLVRASRVVQRAALDAEEAVATFERTDPARRAYNAAVAANRKAVAEVAGSIKADPECFEAALREPAAKPQREKCEQRGQLWGIDGRSGMAGKVTTAAPHPPAPTTPQPAGNR